MIQLPRLQFFPQLGLSTLLSILLLPPNTSSVDSSGVKRLFRDPPRQYSTGPLWVWNDLLTDQQIRDTMRDLAQQNVKQVFVHPRPGLMTPYLSADWFRLWKTALDEAQKLNMNVWIYDENSYPSGFAGGWVPELMPESRGRGLFLRQSSTPPAPAENILGVWKLSGGEASDITAAFKQSAPVGAGPFLVAAVQRAANSPWHGNRCYVDLIYPGVTEKFLELTLEPYRQRFGAEFGNRIPGVFTDEPNIRPAGGLPWTPDLPAAFQKRWGYDLLQHLPSLAAPVGDWRKIRHDYFQSLNELFIERWAKPYHDYCEKYHLEMTGHYWDHEWPRCGAVPDNMAMYAWEQRPAIDCLMNQYQETTYSQFGNLRMAKELSSVANQLGLPRTLCEVYGAGGWDLRFEDMKRIGDWLEVLGVNTLNQHLSYVTIRGARKRDHPQSFSYHEPWWPAYHLSAQYLARVSAALSQGAEKNSVLLLEPTSTAWMYQGDDKALDQLGSSFFSTVQALASAQIEFDLGCEDVIARHGRVAANQFTVGKRSYATVILPPRCENLNSETLRLLQQFASNGGKIISAGNAPTRLDGAISNSPAALGQSKGWQQIEPAALAAHLISSLASAPFSIQRAAGDKGILFHQRRRIDDGEILFLVNSSIDHPSSGQIQTSQPGIEQWNLDSGQALPYAFETSGRGLQAEFHLPPCGSLLLFLSDHTRKPSVVTASQPRKIPSTTGTVDIHRAGPNVLTLDYVDITAGGETRTHLYFYQAQQFAFEKNGHTRNPWDSAVQFKDELIARTFPTNSGFTATYHFTIQSAPPKQLWIVVERADLYTVQCNGRPVRINPSEWWLDKAFAKIDISSLAHTGENSLTLTAHPMTVYHEIEAAYLLGDFNLEPAEHGFTVTPSKQIALGPWNEQGHPFYSGGVAYRQQFAIDSATADTWVELPHWYGSVAQVNVNGALAGYIASAPWRCDITHHLKRGPNSVEVVVIGTLKNTLGPHHGKPSLGTAWPGMFQRGPNPGPPPGRDYSTVGYGLLAPFEVWRAGNVITAGVRKSN